MTNSTSIFSGHNPITFSEKAALPLFIVQAFLVILLCRLIHMALKPLRQPRVIAEIIGGIILGPSVFGRIPGYMDMIFPTKSINFLDLVANLGLIFFLFLVGLELDLSVLRSNARIALSVSIAGIILPMGVSFAASYAVYTLLTDQSQNFASFVLFMGVAMSITAFPVLARILTELKLLRTHVGSLTISAAAVDDACAWCLLALVMSILHASSALEVLWILLCGVGYATFVFLVVRPLFLKYEAKCRTEHGPSQGIILVTILMVLGSAWITDTIGIHAIFGAFLIGVIMPHDGGFAIGVTEKIEDFISLLFLPLYFTLSGLRTNIALLNDGVTWGMLVLVVVVAFAGKLSGCIVAAKLNKMSWRESAAVGVLMSCKGLVELIVLNLGLDAGIINPKVFVVMVMMAIITTFLTTPLSLWIYPEQHHTAIRYPEQQADDEGDSSAANSPVSHDKSVTSTSIWAQPRLRLLVTLTGMQQVPALMNIVQLLTKRSVDNSTCAETGSSNPLRVFALRLIELTDRTSTVMMASESTLSNTEDSVLNVFRTFGQLAGVAVRSQAVVTSKSDFESQVRNHAKLGQSDIAILAWYVDEGRRFPAESSNPLAHLFINKQPNDPQRRAHVSNSQVEYISSVFDKSGASVVAVLVDNGLAGRKGVKKGVTDATVVASKVSGSESVATPGSPKFPQPAPATLDHHSINEVSVGRAVQSINGPGNLTIASGHGAQKGQISSIVVPFLGGPDDRTALRMALALASGSEGLGVTVFRVIPADDTSETLNSTGRGGSAAADNSDSASDIVGKSTSGIVGSTADVEVSSSDYESSLLADIELLHSVFPDLGDSPTLSSASRGAHTYVTVDGVTPGRSITKMYSELDRGALVVVGRRRVTTGQLDPTKTSIYYGQGGTSTSTSSSASSSAAGAQSSGETNPPAVDPSELKALGQTSAELLALGRIASVLVVQGA